MKTKTRTFYVCEKCKEEYDTKTEAKSCERKSITQDKGVKVGDIVLITSGDGTGKRAKVTRRYIIDKYWGHHAWQRYWHTVAVNADIIGSYAGRMLLFDSYKLIKKRR